MESSILLAEKLVAVNSELPAKQAIALTQHYSAHAFERIEIASRGIIAAVSEGDMLRTQIAIHRRLAKHDPANPIALGRQIAGHVLDAGRYSL
jgi:hypothetical protein